ncbi:unnamed protein product [Urochloa decumbens]|uniref:F-box domain-containing protein n=1 Tax=Urochloa decumbens TaxID=240449 RepID=A0ABC9EY18_9POAL
MEKVASIDEMVTEIAIRVPPSDPARLVNFASVCKRWLGILTKEAFRRAYATRHGRPPFLVPTAPPYPRLSPDVGTDNWYALDARQGRVLLFRNTPDLIVWFPVSGEHFLLPEPPRPYQYHAGAVICADSPHCSDPNCYSLHDFRVIFVGCQDELTSFNQITFFQGNETWESVCSSDTDKWGDAYALKDARYHSDHPLIERSPPVIHRDALYFTLEMHALEGEEVRAALKFDLDAKELSVVLGPEDANPDSRIFLATSEGLAWAGTTVDADEDAEDEDEDEGEMNGQNNICLWTLGDNEPPVWALTSDINLDTTLSSGAISPTYNPAVVGFVEGEETIFIDSGERIFSVDVGSSKTIGPSGRSLAVLPFSHYYMPSMPEESNKKTETEGYAVEFTKDEGVNGPEDKKNTTSKAGVIGQKRGLEAEAPSGNKKPKGEQNKDFSGADELSTQEKTLGDEDLE